MFLLLLTLYHIGAVLFFFLSPINCSTTPQFISDLESDYEMPSKDVLQRIIQVLDIESNDSKELYDMIVDSKPIQRVPTNMEYQAKNNKKIIVALRVAKDLEATNEEWSDFIRRLQGNDLEGCE